MLTLAQASSRHSKAHGRKNQDTRNGALGRAPRHRPIGFETLEDRRLLADLYVADAAITEGGTLQFSVTLSEPLEQDVGLWYATRDGSADTSDYYQDAQGATIPAYSTGITIPVSTKSDYGFESDETMYLDVSVTSGNATVVDGTGDGTILNDDEPLTFSIDSAAPGTEGDTLQFRVSTTGSHMETVSVSWGTRDGTATASQDYSGGSGTLYFSQSVSEQWVEVQTSDDSNMESTENLFVDLSNPTGGWTIANGTGEGTIYDNDTPPAEFSISDASVTEGGTLQFCVTLANQLDHQVSVNYATSDGSAGSGDYTGSAGTVYFSAYGTEEWVQVSTSDDYDYESTENMFVGLSNPSEGSIVDGTGEGTIYDNDTPTLPTVSIGGAQGYEDAGNMYLPVTLSCAVSWTVSVDFMTREGSATAWVDYSAGGYYVQFPPNTTYAEAPLTPYVDTDVESDENVYFDLSNPVGATIGVGTAEAWILNDDSPLRLSEGVTPPSGTAENLSAEQLQPIVTQAISIWAAARIRTDGLAAIDVRIADLPGSTLGTASPGRITIDVDAAGHGWFTDTSALPSGQRADLLTTVLHEFGHELGYDDVADQAFAGLMAAHLPLDTRRLPGAQPVSAQAADRLFAEYAGDIARALQSHSPLDDTDLLALASQPV